MATYSYTTSGNADAPPSAENLARALQDMAAVIRRELKPKAAKRVLAALNAYADRLDHCGRADRVVSIREPRPHSGAMAERYVRAAIIRHIASGAF